MKLIYTLIFALAPALALAEPALIVQGGKLYYSDGSGTPARALDVPASALGNVHYMPGETPPQPPEEPPEEPTDVESKVQAWAEEIDEPGVAMVLSDVYEFIARQIDRGRIEPTRESLQRALAVLVVGALDETEVEARRKGIEINRSAWNDFLNAKLSTVIVEALGEDNVMPRGEAVNLFNSIAAGLEGAHEGHAIPDVFRDILNTLIQLLLEWLIDLIGGF